MKKLILAIGLLTLMASCQSGNENEAKDKNNNYNDAIALINNTTPIIHKIIAKEAISGGTYTYLRFYEDGKESWAAITARPITIGGIYYYDDAMEMKDFHSKQLDKTFESILFIQNFGDQPFDKTTKKDIAENPHGKSITNTKVIEPITPVEGGISIEELFSNKEKYNGKSVLVKGQVVKINKRIMDRNWIHIQDGTLHNEDFDLTVTTANEVDFKLGDIITFNGSITLNKDFGAGYNYTLIMEEAVKQ
ncbi:MAG: hypothetical protein JEZ03_14175 [Bacteroidales bacterium]|nr:hypothetical protein [Bacteroidales bacterium]